MNKPITPNTEQVNSTFTNRIIIFGIIILIGLGGLITRYGYLQVYAHDQYTTQADNNRIKLISAPPSRGYIYDRNGVILADNQPVFTAMLSPDEVEFQRLIMGFGIFALYKNKKTFSRCFIRVFRR